MIGKVVWKYEGGIVMGLRRVVCDRRFGSVLVVMWWSSSNVWYSRTDYKYAKERVGRESIVI